MKIAVWRTGHEIADRVAQSLARGFNADLFDYRVSSRIEEGYEAILGYGILRGTDEIFRQADREGLPWLNVDRGYFNPSHFEGYYRISYRGTQARWHEGIPRKPISIKLEPWRTRGDYVLICPPTEAVCQFYGIDQIKWINNAQKITGPCVVRTKNTSQPLEWHLSNAKAVITFNSSVGWKALQMGIPVLSDVNNSAIGSFYQHTDLNKLIDSLSFMPDNRLQLFEAMQAHQFTLAEIEQGKAWDLLNHYISSSATIAGKPSPPMFAPTPSENGLKRHFQSST